MFGYHISEYCCSIRIGREGSLFFTAAPPPVDPKKINFSGNRIATSRVMVDGFAC